MEQLSDVLKQTQPKNISPPSAIFDVLREWKGMGENMLKSLVDYVSDIESREQKLTAVRESLEKRLKDLEERERIFDLFQEGKKRDSALREGLLSSTCEHMKEVELREKKLDEQLELVREHIQSLELARSEVQGLRLLECKKLKKIKKREKEIDSTASSLEKRLREIEQREKEVHLYQEDKSREVALKEELLSRKWEAFVKEVRLTNEKLRKQDELSYGVVERLDSSLNMFEGVKVKINEKFKEIKSWETVAHKSLIAILNEADLIRESLEKRSTECEEMEREFNMFQEDKMRKLEAKERQLRSMRKKLLKEIKLKDEKLTERFKEMESWETLALKTLTASLNEANLIRESLEKRFKEFEEMAEEFNSIQENKMQKLESKRTQLLKVVKLKDEKSTEIQKLGHQTLASLEEVFSEKLKEIESREVSLGVALKALGTRAKDTDLTRESADKWLQELEKREKEFQLYQERKVRELKLAEEKLRLIGEEFIQVFMLREEKFDMQVKMMQRLLERLELAQNNVKDMNTLVSQRFKKIGLKAIEPNHTTDSVERKMDESEVNETGMKEQVNITKLEEDVALSDKKELEGKKKELEMKERSLGSWRKGFECNEPHLKDFVENLESNKLDQPEIYLVENPAGYLAENDQQSECSLRDIEVDGKQNGDLTECEFEQPQLTDARSRVELDHRKRAIHMDKKTLEMLINNTEKDLELIGAEVFKVLFLSSDPAKLVLDAIEEFCASHSRKGDIEVSTRRKGILVLDQLTKMSPSIQPCVRKAAIKLASEWKSKMSTAENSLEVLGFLHFLAAYSLSSCFDKDELLSLLKMVAQHKQTPELCRILGLSENLPGFVQNLINEKRYLLASTYIHECGLENMFPQAAVLNYYVQHSKAKRRRELTSPEAQDKAIASEIADLRIAVKHIIKHGLESEYSPDILTARVKQLERNLASLRNGTIFPTDARKHGKNQRFAQMRKDANKRDAQETAKEVSLAPDAQNPEHGSENGHFPARDARKWQSKTISPNSTSKRRKLTRGWIALKRCAPSEVSS